MFSLEEPVVEIEKLIVRNHNHVNRNILNLIRSNVENTVLNVELLPGGELKVRGSYDLSLCYSSVSNTGEPGCVLLKLHKRFEENIPVSLDSDKLRQNLQPVLAIKEEPTCSTVISGTVIESTVNLLIGVKLYANSTDFKVSGLDEKDSTPEAAVQEDIIVPNNSHVDKAAINLETNPEAKLPVEQNIESQKNDSLVDYSKSSNVQEKRNRLNNTVKANNIVRGKTKIKNR